MPKKVKKKGAKGRKGKGKKKGGKKSSKSTVPGLNQVERFIEFSFKTRIDEIKLWSQRRTALVEENVRLAGEIKEKTAAKEQMARDLRAKLSGSKSSMDEASGKVQNVIEEALAKKYRLKADTEAELTALSNKCDDMWATVKERQRYLHGLKEYQVFGHQELSKQLTVLEQTRADLKQQHQQALEDFEAERQRSKQRLEDRLSTRIDQTKQMAAEKAVRRRSLPQRLDLADREWLRGEVDTHEKEHERLAQSCDALEQAISSMLASLMRRSGFGDEYDEDYYLDEDDDDSEGESSADESSDEDEAGESEEAEEETSADRISRRLSLTFQHRLSQPRRSSGPTAALSSTMSDRAAMAVAAAASSGPSLRTSRRVSMASVASGPRFRASMSSMSSLPPSTSSTSKRQSLPSISTSSFYK